MTLERNILKVLMMWCDDMQMRDPSSFRSDDHHHHHFVWYETLLFPFFSFHFLVILSSFSKLIIIMNITSEILAVDIKWKFCISLHYVPVYSRNSSPLVLSWGWAGGTFLSSSFMMPLKFSLSSSTGSTSHLMMKTQFTAPFISLVINCIRSSHHHFSYHHSRFKGMRGHVLQFCSGHSPFHTRVYCSWHLKSLPSSTSSFPRINFGRNFVHSKSSLFLSNETREEE